MKKIINLFLVSIMILMVFVSCKPEKEEIDEEENPADAAVDGPETSGEEDVLERVYPNLPDADFGGYDFNFLTVYDSGIDWTDWDPRDIYAEAESGDLINDAVYKRNAIIEEKYSIKITETCVLRSAFNTRFRTSVASGDDDFDAAMPYLQEVVSYAQQGWLTDLHSIDRVDLSKPWWNQSCVSQMSVGGRLYFVQSDITVIDNDAMEAMVFNKDIIQHNELESPYELVNAGKWTLDKLIEMSKNVSSDLNGDGIMDLRDDRFGLVVQRTSFLSFYAAAGGTIVGKDKDDLPYINFSNEKNYLLLAKLTEMMQDKQNAVDLHRYEGKFAIYDEQAKMFSEGRALFMWLRMRVVENLRNMETDFGIIPMPKADELQKNYIGRINHNVSTALTVSKTNADLERTGIVLEALAGESKYTLQPAYYELNLKTKFARDSESEAMLDIIYDTRNMLYDLAEIYNFGDFAGTIRGIPTHDRNADYASQFEKYEPKMQKDIEKIIENYE
ncbi:MAG: hypothetical protein FWG34_09385 [Oscillospiraceae bacterium]|nr:hypothetical protein [Oscillospiraceae bacterium]